MMFFDFGIRPHKNAKRILILFISLFAAITPVLSPESGEQTIQIGFIEVATGFPEMTELVFPPNETDSFFVLQKGGTLSYYQSATKTAKSILSLPVLTSSEQGLLGMVLHPDFLKNGKIYLHYSPSNAKKRIGRISEWVLVRDGSSWKWNQKSERVLLEIEQPYANHDGGCLRMTSDGMLYIGMGDGGSGGDPKGNGQNTRTLLGAMLRIQPEPAKDGRPYTIPSDNPFRNNSSFRPEIWATGLRNPWKFSFAPDGRMILADVGQNKWEEINIVEAGKNYGWNIKEGTHCYLPERNCPDKGLTDPIYEYSHGRGQSITGGYVYTGSSVPSLKNKYIFADFVSGEMMALDLPAEPGQKTKAVYSLGKTGMHIATFGQNHAGEIFVGDFSSGTIYRVSPP